MTDSLEDWMAELDVEDMLAPPTVYEATGETYSFRSDFVSWGWHWVPDRRAWQLETKDEHDPCLKWARRKPGIKVRRLEGNRP